MISEFLVYLRLGFDHITDIRGYDHILFVAALTAVYRLDEWRKLLRLVTAFTVGHSLTLGLATLEIIRVSSKLVETLIPVTIVATSAMNITGGKRVGTGEQEARGYWWWKYGLATFFGLIHGMGFSNFLRAVLGGEDSIVFPLFAFNVGLELGQALIVLVVLVVGVLGVKALRGDRRVWTMLLSGATAGIALVMIVGRFFDLT